MVKMVRYGVFGFKSEDEFFGHFFQTLLKTNWTYQYFVDWNKVREKVRVYIKEIGLLNSLTKMSPNERRMELEEILLRYPETIPVIPLIIATREQRISVIDVGEKAVYSTFNFSKRRLTEGGAKDLADFCENVGILQLLGEIDDLYAYLQGVEIGLDSNARKNRSGKIFEELIGLLLRRKLKDFDVEIRAEDQSVAVGRKKRADFVVYFKNKPRIVVECNFYNTTGSKPIETANAYVDLQRKIRGKEDISFIWITDGPAWGKMKQTIMQSFREIDFPMNYTEANERIGTVISNVLSLSE